MVQHWDSASIGRQNQGNGPLTGVEAVMKEEDESDQETLQE
jgi:hypothetical protein